MTIPAIQQLDHSAPILRTQIFTLREFLVILFKDKYRIAIGFAIPMMLAVVASFMPTPHYEASSTVLVRMGREFLYRPEVGENNAQPIPVDREQALHSEVEILSSRDLQEKVIEQISMERLYPSIARAGNDKEFPRNARALVEMQRRLDVMLLKDSNVIQVSFKHPNSEIAAEVVNRLIDSYLEKRRAIFSDTKVAFAESQVKSFRTRLTALEAKIEEFKQKNEIISFSDQLILLLNQRDDLQNKFKSSTTTLAEIKGKLKASDRNMKYVAKDVKIYSETNHDDTLDKSKKALLDLRLKEGDLSSRYTDRNPLVVNVRNEIKEAEAYVWKLEAVRSDQIRTGRSPVRDSVEFDRMHFLTEQESAKEGRKELKIQLAAVTKQLDLLSKTQRTLEDMMRERQILDNGYQTYAKKLEEARILDALDRKEKTNVNVIQAALPPIQKKNLQPAILGIGIVLSLCAALVVALISELLRDTFLSPEKLERSLGLPVLTSIPYRSPPQRKSAFDGSNAIKG